jgi:catechol 2,3-dioxygenase-like lactoylglutathione lyase family enzyme
VKLTRLVPMLPVRSMPASVEFYRKLGFDLDLRHDDWRWARLSFGDVRLMLDESINAPPDAPRTSVLYLYPDDIHAYHAKVRSNGVTVPDLDVTFYGMTEFRLDDPDGNRLWIGQEAQEG